MSSRKVRQVQREAAKSIKKRHSVEEFERRAKPDYGSLLQWFTFGAIAGLLIALFAFQFSSSIMSDMGGVVGTVFVTLFTGLLASLVELFNQRKKGDK